MASAGATGASSPPPAGDVSKPVHELSSGWWTTMLQRDNRLSVAALASGTNPTKAEHSGSSPGARPQFAARAQSAAKTGGCISANCRPKKHASRKKRNFSWPGRSTYAKVAQALMNPAPPPGLDEFDGTPHKMPHKTCPWIATCSASASATPWASASVYTSSGVADCACMAATWAHAASSSGGGDTSAAINWIAASNQEGVSLGTVPGAAPLDDSAS
mmetsp:Transcript_18640/g.51107  ORF Transcript_18640/g.51107 Transcript_18640/m.51107 type:complete len:217 (+) Transcript_18640:438-1088(+)